MKTTRADRRKDINSYNHWVYGLYIQNKLIYIGVTADPAGRLVNHTKTKIFDEYRLIKGFSNRAKADEFEKFSIIALNPSLNIMKLRTDFEPRSIALKDFERFNKSRGVCEFDLNLLDNKCIARRKRWQARC